MSQEPIYVTIRGVEGVTESKVGAAMSGSCRTWLQSRIKLHKLQKLAKNRILGLWRRAIYQIEALEKLYSFMQRPLTNRLFPPLVFPLINCLPLTTYCQDTREPEILPYVPYTRRDILHCILFTISNMPYKWPRIVGVRFMHLCVWHYAVQRGHDWLRPPSRYEHTLDEGSRSFKIGSSN